MCERIQARAILRLGEVLKEIPPDKGGRPSQTQDGTALGHGAAERRPYPVATTLALRHPWRAPAADSGMGILAAPAQFSGFDCAQAASPEKALTAE
jgi:hypothetical protein